MAPRSKSKKARKTTRKSTSSSTAVATRKQSSPDEDGVPGVDYSETPPVGHVNTGDGSDENPHNIVASPDWHSPRVAR